MIERYTRPEMGAIWTEENRYRAWLEVEILACEAWAELGEIPWEDVKKIREKASFSVERIKEIEESTRHDVWPSPGGRESRAQSANGSTTGSPPRCGGYRLICSNRPTPSSTRIWSCSWPFCGKG